MMLISPLQAVSLPKIQSKQAILIDPERDLTLFDKLSEVKVHPSSTTKMGLVLYALKIFPNLDEKVVVPEVCLKKMAMKEKIRREYMIPPHLLEPDGYEFGLKKGEIITIKTLIDLTLLVSANDSANVLAYYAGGGSIEEGMIGCNQFLESIGCSSTLFFSPSGLEYPGHLSTAKDLAIILKEGLKSEVFYSLISKEEGKFPSTLYHKEEKLRNTHRLIRKDSEFYYPWAIGGKTGYIGNAGYCLTTAAKKEGRTLIAVVMNAPTKKQRFIDTLQLLEWGFSEKKIARTLFTANDPCFSTSLEGAKEPLVAFLETDFIAHYYPSEEADVRISIAWESLSLPIKKGQKVGEVIVFNEKGIKIQSAPIFATKEIKKSFFPTLILLLIAAFSLWWFIPRLSRFFRSKESKQVP